VCHIFLPLRMMAAKTALIIHDAWKLLSRKGRSAYFLQILEFAYLLPTTPSREWFLSSSVNTAIFIFKGSGANSATLEMKISCWDENAVRLRGQQAKKRRSASVANPAPYHFTARETEIGVVLTGIAAHGLSGAHDGSRLAHPRQHHHLIIY
jgi:hypothetical protein